MIRLRMLQVVARVYAAEPGLLDRRRRVNGRDSPAERQRQHDLAELVVVEVLGDHERLRQADEHALVALGERRRRERQR